MRFRFLVWPTLLLLEAVGILPTRAGLPPYHLEEDLGRDLASPSARELLGTNQFRSASASDSPGYFTELAQQARARAETGDALAQVRLGAAYESGLGVPQDDREAVRWYRLAAEQQQPVAQYRLGLLLERGAGGVTNRVEAAEWYRRAAEGGYAPAQLLQGVALSLGSFGVTNMVEALAWLSRAAEQKLPVAVYQVGMAHLRGRGTPTNSALALRWITQAAELGYKQAYVSLAILRADPGQPEYDAAEAARWCRRAAKTDAPHGRTLLGVALMSGDIMPRNLTEGLRWLRSAAEAGDPYAQAELGAAYMQGESVPSDYPEALRWLEPAASRGVALAQNDLGLMNEFGRGTATNHARAFQFYHLAAHQGYPAAMGNLARCFRLGRGTATNMAEHTWWLRHSAEVGYDKAQVQLGWSLLTGHFGETNLAEGIHWLELGARTRPAAMVMLGLVYQTGESAPTNYAKTFEWYERAARVGDLDGQFRLACCHLAGLGTPKNLQLAIEGLEKAADAGSGDAAGLLGVNYLRGQEGFPRDDEQARKWLERGVALHHPKSIGWLGAAFLEGRGMPKDPTRGFELVRRSAEAGAAQNQELLAVCYATGVGTSTNLTEAVRWLRRAGAQNCPSAQMTLAQVLRDGVWDVPRDPAAALPFLRAAASNGLVRAQFELGVFMIQGLDGRTNLTEAAVWFQRAAEQGHPMAQRALANLVGGGFGVPLDLETAYVWARLAEKGGERVAHHYVVAAMAKLPPGRILALDRRVREFQPRIEPVPVPPVENPSKDEVWLAQ